MKKERAGVTWGPPLVMRWQRIAAGLCLAALHACPVHASAIDDIKRRGELRVGMDVGAMPFEMRDTRGEIVGFDVDIAKLMARALGVKAALINSQWDGLIPSLLTGKIDIVISGMTITPDRKLTVAFTDSYFDNGQGLLLRSGLETIVKSRTDLNEPKYRIAAQLGTTGDIAARKWLSRAELRQFETPAECFLELRNGRVDAWVFDMSSLAIYQAQGRAMTLLREPLLKEQLGWAIRKDDPDFLKWLNGFLAEIRGNGSYERLHEKWFGGTAWLPDVQGH
jgi:polar amino acid transport system substrate-binding protein